MKEDFAILRASLKNIEIVLYDELYNNLLNLQHRLEISSKKFESKDVRKNNKLIEEK